MARVTITLEDVELTGGDLIDIRVESDPPLPIARVTDPRWLAELRDLGYDDDLDLDVEHATPAQVAARMAAGEILGHSKAAAAMVRPE